MFFKNSLHFWFFWNGGAKVKRKYFLIYFFIFAFAIFAFAVKSYAREIVKDKGDWFSIVGQVSLSESLDKNDEILFFEKQYFALLPKSKIIRIKSSEKPHIEITKYNENNKQIENLKKDISNQDMENLLNLAFSTKMNNKDLKAALNCHAHNVFYMQIRKNDKIYEWSIPSCGSEDLEFFLNAIKNYDL